MAERPKTTIPPPPPRPAGTDDFSKMVGAALANVSVDVSDGSAPPPPHGSVPSLPPVIPTSPHLPPVERAFAPPPEGTGEVVPQLTRRGPEDDATLSYQAMLREEERLIALRPKLPDPPQMNHLAGSYLTGASQPVLVIREGADPLHVECYNEFVRLTAGGLIMPYANQDKVRELKERLKKAVEYVPPVIPPTEVKT